MPLTIVRNDITKMRVDAIVNAANTSLSMGGGVCGAIFSASGAAKLKTACNQLAPIQTGEAVITPGFGLPAKYVIHAAGPVYQGGKHGEEKLLRSCYTNALDLAQKNGCKSIAFPLISSGIYGYPKDEALAVATSAIGKWLLENDMDVSLVVFDKTAFELSRKLNSEVKAFIDENYAGDYNNTNRRELLYAEINAFEAVDHVRFQQIASAPVEFHNFGAATW
ncbi:MAG: macro domain-containing protein, partial [Synergistaceae bacterium]|nr:macro domain-containing protein [Synergistaceae bacterium]